MLSVETYAEKLSLSDEELFNGELIILHRFADYLSIKFLKTPIAIASHHESTFKIIYGFLKKNHIF